MPDRYPATRHLGLYITDAHTMLHLDYAASEVKECCFGGKRRNACDDDAWRHMYALDDGRVTVCVQRISYHQTLYTRSYKWAARHGWKRAKKRWDKEAGLGGDA